MRAPPASHADGARVTQSNARSHPSRWFPTPYAARCNGTNREVPHALTQQDHDERVHAMSGQIAADPLVLEDFAPDDFAMVRPALVRKFNGDVAAAYMLARLRYRCQAQHPDSDGTHWWRTRIEDLADELGMSNDQTKRLMKKLIGAGMVAWREDRVRGVSDRVRSYKIIVDGADSPRQSGAISHPLDGADSPRLLCKTSVEEEQKKEQEHARPSGRADGDEAEAALLPAPQSTEEPKPSTSRGSRLPEHWAPSPDLARWTVEHLGDPERCRTELATFRDYWIAVPGARGRKVSWEATWRNWVRRAAERGGPAPRAGGNRQETTGDRRRREFAETLAALNGDRS